MLKLLLPWIKRSGKVPVPELDICQGRTDQRSWFKDYWLNLSRCEENGVKARESRMIETTNGVIG